MLLFPLVWATRRTEGDRLRIEVMPNPSDQSFTSNLKKLTGLGATWDVQFKYGTQIPIDVTASINSAPLGQVQCVINLSVGLAGVPYSGSNTSNTFVSDVAHACGMNPNLPASAYGRW